jgi:hypothetical protein
MSVVVNLIISGICAVVPAGDSQIRVTCPKASHGAVASDMMTAIPPHYPYLLVREENVAKPADVKFRFDDSKGTKLAWVFRSVDIKLDSMTKSKKAGNDVHSLRYIADMREIWPNSGGVKDEYFDIKQHHKDLIAARADVTYDNLETGLTLQGDAVWQFLPSVTPNVVEKRLTQEIIAACKVNGSTAILRVHDYDIDQDYEIHLKASGKKPVDVWMGNAPIDEIMHLDLPQALQEPQDHHFELYYPMLKNYNGQAPASTATGANPPMIKPIPKRKLKQGEKVGGGSGDCVPMVAD